MNSAFLSLFLRRDMLLWLAVIGFPVGLLASRNPGPWVTAFLILLAGLLTHVTLHELRRREFTWTLPGFRRRMNRELLGLGVVIALIGGLVYAATGGVAPWFTVVAVCFAWMGLFLGGQTWLVLGLLAPMPLLGRIQTAAIESPIPVALGAVALGVALWFHGLRKSRYRALATPRPPQTARLTGWLRWRHSMVQPGWAAWVRSGLYEGVRIPNQMGWLLGALYTLGMSALVATNDLWMRQDTPETFSMRVDTLIVMPALFFLITVGGYHQMRSFYPLSRAHRARLSWQLDLTEAVITIGLSVGICLLLYLTVSPWTAVTLDAQVLRNALTGSLIVFAGIPVIQTMRRLLDLRDTECRGRTSRKIGHLVLVAAVLFGCGMLSRQVSRGDLPEWIAWALGGLAVVFYWQMRGMIVRRYRTVDLA